jgi:hypothetical protein
MRFLVMRLDFDVHQVLDFEGIQIAADHHPQVVADELHDMVVVLDLWVLREHGAALRIFDVALD